MKWKYFIVAIVSIFLVAFIGSLFTNTGEWYESIKPDITPPGWVFPVVWNILFLLIAISFYLAMVSSDKKEIKKVVIVFIINFILNILWSYFFFSLQKPFFAFIELILLWFSILVMIYVTAGINKISPILL
ncbi:MAG: TspO/MBR family protein, partial [Candidatus Nanoarchaeia archaeon]